MPTRNTPRTEPEGFLAAAKRREKGCPCARGHFEPLWGGGTAAAARKRSPCVGRELLERPSPSASHGPPSPPGQLRTQPTWGDSPGSSAKTPWRALRFRKPNAAPRPSREGGGANRLLWAPLPVLLWRRATNNETVTNVLFLTGFIDRPFFTFLGKKNCSDFHGQSAELPADAGGRYEQNVGGSERGAPPPPRRLLL